MNDFPLPTHTWIPTGLKVKSRSVSKWDEEKTFYHHCPICNHFFNYQIKDMNFYTSAQYSTNTASDSKDFIGVLCPYCHTANKV